MTDGHSASLSWCRAPIWSPWPDFCFLSDSCGILDVGHPLRREDGSVICLYNCFWALPEQSPLSWSPAELTTIFYCLFETPCIYIPQDINRRIHDSQGYGGGILTRLHTGSFVRPLENNTGKMLLYYCVRSCIAAELVTMDIFFYSHFICKLYIHSANGVNLKKKKKKDMKRSAQQHTSKSNRLKA
jgi:hypothetical protein